MSEVSGNEKWLPVVGWEGYYEVSDHGRVRSLARRIERSTGAVQILRPRILAPKKSRAGNGYVRYNLARDATVTTVLLHRVVLEAFVGPCPAGMQCLHRNGIRDDCRLENLHWDTAAENYRDIRRHGRIPGRQKQDQCERGHDRSERNTRVDPRTGTRHCRVCVREWMRARRIELKAESAERLLARAKTNQERAAVGLPPITDELRPQRWP